MTKQDPDYCIPAKCHVCGRGFKARYNVGKRAKTCTLKSHACQPGLKGTRKVTCLEMCCRAKYLRASASMAGSSIDKRKVLSDLEYKQTLAATKKLEDPVGIALRFILETGCRLGEALLVRREHLERGASELSVVRMPTLKKAGHPLLPVHLDNKTPLTRELWTWAEKLKPGDELFPVGRRTLQRTLERIFDTVKPDRASLVHLLRHTRASRLTQSGLDPNTIRSEMRWASIELLKTYSHTTEEAVAAALGRIR